MSHEGAKPVQMLIWNTTSKTWEKFDGSITTGDIEIGAVEIKDHDGTDRAAVTSSNALKVDASAVTQPISEASPSALVAFITDIPSAGSRVQLASNTVIAGVIQAPSTNTGNIFIGGSDVSSTVFGSELQPGQSVGVAINNTNLIQVDVATSGDDVAFLGS